MTRPGPASTAEALDRLLPALRAELPGLLDDVAGALYRTHPPYGGVLADARDDILPPAESAIARIVAHATATIADSGPTKNDTRSCSGDELVMSLFHELGRDQWRRGLPLDDLLTAYQLGGRIGWRHMATCATRLAVPVDALAALAEGVFRLVDEISSATTSGYVDEQTASAVEREHRRDVLAELLLSDRANTAAVEQAARAAGWSLPVSAAVILADPGDQPAMEALGSIEDALLVRHRSLTGAIVPRCEHPARRDRITLLLRTTTAVVGPNVPLTELPESARIAELAGRIVDRRPVDGGPVFAADHLDEMVVHGDEQLLTALQDAVLRPLAGTVPAQRAVLGDTLRSWLRHMGDRRVMAEELGVHPQTVRYRLARLRQLYGDALDDPAARLQLVLALEWPRDPSGGCRAGDRVSNPRTSVGLDPVVRERGSAMQQTALAIAGRSPQVRRS